MEEEENVDWKQKVSYVVGVKDQEELRELSQQLGGRGSNGILSLESTTNCYLQFL